MLSPGRKGASEFFIIIMQELSTGQEVGGSVVVDWRVRVSQPGPL